MAKGMAATRGMGERDSGLQVVGRSLVGVHSSTALEIIRQLNLEQDSIPSGSSIRGMFAMWETVSKRKARKTNNISWKTSVDVGFRYLVRLHFSDVRLKMTEINGIAFEVRINDMIAATNIDIVSEMDDKNMKFLYKDYIVMINGQKQEGKQDLLICLHSNEEFMDAHAPLNGLEIMKLSNPDNSLACPNPLPSAQDSSCWSVQKLHQVLGHKNVIATVAVALLTMVNIIIHKLRIIWEVSGAEEENVPSARAQQICRRISLGEILLATRNFSDAHLIGKGGFGKVYKGLINNSQQTAAIKRLKPNSKQGAHEFLTEIETLTKLRHINLVSLIGYCNEHGEMILVYEYMACGTLADRLYKHERKCHDCASLTWKQSLSICIGAARGLDYLHTGNSLIHRDVKASNILLDENLIAKVSDFGLAKYLNRSKLQSHVSTKVKGTYWYMDPSYVTTGKLTRKSDTYAFGVLLFEVLSGRPAVDTSVAHDERVLITWARENISLGRADKIVASYLRGKISEDSLKAFVGIAERCMHGEPHKRPTMTQVVLQLEFALEQQESSKCLVSSAIKSCVDDIHPSRDEKKLASGHTYEKNYAHPNKEQAMNKMGFVVPPSRRKNVQKDIIPKLSWLRRWDVLLNRGNSLMNTDKTSGDQATKLVQKNEHGVYILPVNASAAPLDELKDKHNINMLPVSIPAIRADELKDITDIFGLKCSILEGFCGRVYYGFLKSGQPAAIKKLESRNQPYQEFLAKASMLGNLKHENVVELLGYCVDDGLRVLAYEFGPYMTFFMGKEASKAQIQVRLYHGPKELTLQLGLQKD